MTNDSDEVRMVKIEKDIEYIKKGSDLAGKERQLLFTKIDNLTLIQQNFINTANITYATKKELYSVKKDLAIADNMQDTRGWNFKQWIPSVISTIIAGVALVMAVK